MGCYAFLQGLFLIQGSNLHHLRLLHWQVDFLFKPLSNLGSPDVVIIWSKIIAQSDPGDMIRRYSRRAEILLLL